MVTKEEFWKTVRSLVYLLVDLTLRVVAIQKMLELKGDLPQGWIDGQVGHMKTQGEYLRAMAAIAKLGEESEPNLSDILKGFQGPIQ